METLTAEFCTILGRQMASGLSGSAGNRILRLQMVSAKGLTIESSDNILKAQLHVLFRERVLRSSEVVVNSLNSSEVVFDFTADFIINDLDFVSMSTVGEINFPIQILLTVAAPTISQLNEESIPVGTSYTKQLRALAVLDCRLALLHSTSFMSVELMPCEFDGLDTSGLGGGLLFVRMSILEDEVIQDLTLSSSDLQLTTEYIHRHQSRLSLASQDNYHRAKIWWSGIRKDFPWIEGRDIKLVASDECGQQRFVCSYLRSIAPPREMNSPRDSARFVSLIPFTRSISLAGGRVCKWKSPFTLLSAMQGDVEDHAVFLCCLLTGWGLDAWVAMGSIAVTNVETGAEQRSKKPHWWVITFDSLPDHRVVFWESLTGQQFDIALERGRKGRFVATPEVNQATADSKTTSAHKAALLSIATESHPFTEIFALFKSDELLVNVQKHPVVSAANAGVDRGSPYYNQTVSFDLTDHKSWVKFPFNGADILRHPGSHLQLQSLPQTVSCSRSEEILEEAIAEMIVNWRANVGLQTRFDDQISRTLHPALVAYELDRSLAASVLNGTSDFQCSVRKLVHRGECFKAYPTCFSHCNPTAILMTLRQTAVVHDVVTAKSVPGASSSDHAGRSLTRHGVRVKIFPYPEGLCAVWVMLAVCYFDKSNC